MNNPFNRAVLAVAYITLVASTMESIPAALGNPPEMVGGILFLSLLCLSAAIMAYLFFWHPVTLFLAGKTEEASKALGRMLASFALIALSIGVVIAIVTRLS